MRIPFQTSSLPFFAYRRLAGLITCEMNLGGAHRVPLDSKYQVNSFQDVFCHPFYWQLFSWIKSPPELVVDLGAHCGHFSMLADVCFRTRFGKSETEYLLVEPNPALTPVIVRNLERSGLCRRYSLQQGLVGAREGDDVLWVSTRNYLASSLRQQTSARAIPTQYLDLDKLVGPRAIDLLKVDIEGAEYDFVANYPALLGRVQRLMIELHDAPNSRQQALMRALSKAGLHPVSEALEHEGFRLAMFDREGTASHL